MIKSLDRTGTWRTYSMADGLAGVRIEHIAEDNEGYLWFAIWDNGVSRFDGDEFQNFTRQDGLVSDRVYFVFSMTVKIGCGSVQQMVSAGTTGQISTIWRTMGLQAAQCSFIYEDRQGPYMVWWSPHSGILRRYCVPRPDSALSSALRGASFSFLAQPVLGHYSGS